MTTTATTETESAEFVEFDATEVGPTLEANWPGVKKFVILTADDFQRIQDLITISGLDDSLEGIDLIPFEIVDPPADEDGDW